MKLSVRQERRYREGREDYRRPAQIDRDRVLYSGAFARLAEVTQVVPAREGYAFHNRLTHSLKVAQLARRMAEKLLAEQMDESEALGILTRLRQQVWLTTWDIRRSATWPRRLSMISAGRGAG